MKRLEEAWMDIKHLHFDAQNPATDQLGLAIIYNRSLPDNQVVTSANQNTTHMTDLQKAQYPSQVMARTLFFVIQSDMSAEQLRMLMQRAVYDSKTLKTYTMEWLTQMFRGLGASPSAALENPWSLPESRWQQAEQDRSRALR